jgi:hypothetical protein
MDSTDQFKVSGLIVFSLFLCFAHVLQLAFSNLAKNDKMIAHIVSPKVHPEL